jgi:type I restriction enzyme R subunit
MQALGMEFRRLPAQCTKDVRAEKFTRAYGHGYDHYA